MSALRPTRATQLDDIAIFESYLNHHYKASCVSQRFFEGILFFACVVNALSIWWAIRSLKELDEVDFGDFVLSASPVVASGAVLVVFFARGVYHYRVELNYTLTKRVNSCLNRFHIAFCESDGRLRTSHRRVESNSPRSEEAWTPSPRTQRREASRPKFARHRRPST
mmetsp:Transcript_35119/g.81964  ORF Transcript_35119/g.81964 Transcript_35119/m.81964 type:complete len:167 (-) Transcript_35119:85-585(-)